MHRLIALLLLAATPAVAQPPQQAPDLDRINQLFFKQYDADGDGLVTGREFLTPSMAQFDYLDRNDDGIVDMGEVSAFTQMMTEQAMQRSQARPLPQPQSQPPAQPPAQPARQ